MAWNNYNRSKYGAKKVEADGMIFDSKKEYKRWCELRILQKAGAITDLQRQVKYVLIPAQREHTNEIYTKGSKKGCFKPGKLLEREVAYIADFRYRDAKTGELVVEDTKGMRTKEYILKRKMMLYFYGIKIKEV